MRSRSGFTLLETIVALAIMAIAITGVLQAFSSSTLATKEAQTYTTASVLANQVASQLDRDPTVTAGELSGTFEDTSAYTWTATVESPDSNNLMRTKIIVSWGSDAKIRHFEMVICLHPGSSSADQQSSTNASSGSSGGG